MKRLALLLPLLLGACAHTELYSSRTGRALLRTQMDAAQVDYVNTREGISFHVLQMNHSQPTLAGGQALAMGVDAGGRFVVSAGLAYSSSGLGKIAGAALPFVTTVVSPPAKPQALTAH